MIIKHSPSSHDQEANGIGGDDEYLEEQKTFKKGCWTIEEDTILADYVKKHGEGNWSLVEKQSGLARSGKSIRLRWLNHLNPDLKRGPFTDEEERQILHLHAMFGNKWARIAAELPGRTDNEIKNFWHTRRKKLERAGLPLYPDGIRPRFLDGNQESSSFSTTGGSMFEQGLGLSQFPLMACPLNMQHNSLDSTRVSTAATTLLDQYTGLSGNTSIYEAMKAELIPSLQCIETQQGSKHGTHACSLPSFDETFDAYIQSAPPAKQTQLEPRSPRSNGYLEAIFYPPKVLEGSNDDPLHPCNTKWDEHGEPNSTKKEGWNQRDLTNQDDRPDSGWSWTQTFCSKKDQYDLIKDTLYAIIDKNFRSHH